MFTSYLQRGAVKWIPLDIGFWTLSLIMNSIMVGFDAKMSVIIAELLIRNQASLCFRMNKPIINTPIDQINIPFSIP